MGTSRQVHTGRTMGIGKRSKEPILIALEGMVAVGVVSRFIKQSKHEGHTV